MFGKAKPKKPEVLHHWHELVENFQTSPQDFYAAVEKLLEERKVPGLDSARVEFAEGGMLSAQRQYLRLTRERLVFDICAAPFGTSFFFSCRFAELPLVVNPSTVFAIVAMLGTMFWFFSYTWRWPVATIATLAVAGVSITSLRAALAVSHGDLDAWLMKQPGISGLYEICFRKKTYYREDTRIMYLETVPAVVKRIYEEVTAANGVTMTQQREQAPVQRDLSKAAAS